MRHRGQLARGDGEAGDRLYIVILEAILDAIHSSPHTTPIKVKKPKPTSIYKVPYGLVEARD